MGVRWAAVRRPPPPVCFSMCLKQVPIDFLFIFIILFLLFVTAIVRVIRFFISPIRLRKLFSWSELDASFIFHFDHRDSGSTRLF